MPMEFKQSSFCFGHGVGAHVCGIAGLSFERLNHMNSDRFQSVIIVKIQNENIISSRLYLNVIKFILFQEYHRPTCEYPNGKSGTPMFTGIIAMDPAGPIFETNSIGNIYTYIYRYQNLTIIKIKHGKSTLK